jgi:hypothetical protein
MLMCKFIYIYLSSKNPEIASCEITRCSDTGKPVGTFTCSCGFIYSRRGPDILEEDITKIGRIKQFGSVWNDKLVELFKNNTLSLRGRARELGVDPMTAKRQFNNLIAKTHEAEGGIIVPDGPLSSWSFRNERDLLLRNKQINRNKLQGTRVDWENRDKEMTIKVKEVARRMKPQRELWITKSEIARQTGSLSLISNRLEKMPRTKEELEMIVETTENFQLRRVQLSIKEMRKKSHIIKGWEVAKMAGLSTEAYKRLKRTINDYIDNGFAI